MCRRVHLILYANNADDYYDDSGVDKMLTVISVLVISKFVNCNTPFTRYNRLSKRFDNRFDNRVERTAVRSTGCQTGLYTNRLYHVYKHLPGCQTGLTTGCIV